MDREHSLNIRPSSAWDENGIRDFLRSSTIPLRLACNARQGFPLLNSLWFEYHDDSFWCATHASSAVVPLLQKDGRCAIEVALNDPPYKGVRGQAVAELSRDGAEALLRRLIDRYLGDSNPQLAAWLLGRVDEEYVVRLRPSWLSSWDYSPRMRPRN
jgi:hypothetical protein